jgi:hypothetical protein
VNVRATPAEHLKNPHTKIFKVQLYTIVITFIFQTMMNEHHETLANLAVLVELLTSFTSFNTHQSFIMLHPNHPWIFRRLVLVLGTNLLHQVPQSWTAAKDSRAQMADEAWHR